MALKSGISVVFCIARAVNLPSLSLAVRELGIRMENHLEVIYQQRRIELLVCPYKARMLFDLSSFNGDIAAFK
ncbi:hypothetical protein VCHA53O466_50414 [Vibrio chagasii]|nr:hypothetical protein VCHA53O466_50414 [Vibrio chagasii]